MARRAGQPTKLTPAVKQKVLRLIGNGNPECVATAATGIALRTFRNWVSYGRAAQELVDKGKPVPDERIIFLRFWHDLQNARSKAVQYHVRNIKRLSKNSWQASAWWLERMMPNVFGQDRETIAEMKRIIRDMLKSQRDAAGKKT